MAYEVILTYDANFSLDNLVGYIERECDPEDVKRLSRELVNAVEALSDELAYLPYRNSICLIQGRQRIQTELPMSIQVPCDLCD